MLILPRIYEALLDAGVQVVDTGDGSVDLWLPAVGGPPVAVQLKSRSRPIGTAEIAELSRRYPSEHFVFVAPTFSKASREAITNAGWSWIADREGAAPTGVLSLGGREPLILGAPSNEPAHWSPEPPSKQGRKPWQRFAILRHLLLRADWTQRELADVCEVTQPRVSQVLAQLERTRLVSRTGRRGHGPLTWRATDLDGLLGVWLEEYPGPGGLAPTYWYGLDSVHNQTRAALQALQNAGVPDVHSSHHQHEHHHEHDDDNDAHRHTKERRFPIASGDAAADLIAPYRRSRLAVVYSSHGADLTSAGLTPAARQDATLKLVVPEDRSIWPHSTDDLTAALVPQSPYPIADPIQVMWDLLHDGHPDADQAASAVARAFTKVRRARA